MCSYFDAVLNWPQHTLICANIFIANCSCCVLLSGLVVINAGVRPLTLKFIFSALIVLQRDKSFLDNMLRLAQTSRDLAVRGRVAPFARRTVSAKSVGGPLEADSGIAATRVHHAITTFLVFATPAVFMVPDSWTDGFVDKAFGILVAASVSAHSWIGLNYVATDYVPKVSKSMVGPSRIACAGMSLVTLVGLSKIALNSEGGIKGTIKGLWNPPPKEENA